MDDIEILNRQPQLMKKRDERKIELAGMTIRFGNESLLDKFHEYFLPALRNAKARPSGESTNYKLHGLTLALLDGEPNLIGRILKIDSLKAEQAYLELCDIPATAEAAMQIAPSSLFVINLFTYQLAFLRETPHSPTIKNFSSVVSHLLNRQWKERFRSSLSIATKMQNSGIGGSSNKRSHMFKAV